MAVVGLVLFVALAGVVAYFVYRPEDIQTLCVEVLPRNQRVGVKLSVKRDGTIDADLGGQRGTDSGASPPQIEQFIKCLETTRRVTVENGVRLPLEPIGQVANRWAREGGLKLRLLPGSNPEVLNNIRIGPAAGPKDRVVRNWCGAAQAENCVRCAPPQPDADTVEVVLELKHGAVVEKKQLDGTWPVPPPGSKGEPWQLVDEKGERFFYECRGAQR